VTDYYNLSLHCCTTEAASHYYVDAAYCYRWSSVVCLSVGRSIAIVSPVKTTQPNEMPFGVWTWAGPRNHAVDAVQIPHARVNFDGENVICMANGWLKEYDQQFFYGNVLTATHIKLASITSS